MTPLLGSPPVSTVVDPGDDRDYGNAADWLKQMV